MEANGEKISGDIIRKIYYADRNASSKVFPKLTDTHFSYDTFEKMRVNLAVQILSESVAKGLENVIESGYFSSQSILKVAKATVTFVRNMNILFDMLNAKSKDDPNVNKRGISEDNIHQLKTLYNYILTLKKVSGSTVYWISGLQQTVCGIIGFFEELNSADPKLTLFTRNLNQDPLENLFGLTRVQGGNNRNPYLIDFLRNVSRIMTSKLLITPTETNCEFDESTLVQVLDLESYDMPSEDEKLVYINFYFYLCK